MDTFNFLTTHVGSVPYQQLGTLPEHLSNILDVPAWTQHPRRSFRESMYVQYTSTLPLLMVDETKEKVTMDTRSDMSDMLEEFYGRYLADDVDSFALHPTHAAGFFAMLEILTNSKNNPKSSWAKGQITGPVSFGLTVTDQDLRATLYNDELADIIIKNTAMTARWQIRQLKTARENIIMFLDEPYLASFGSAFISLSREQVISALDEIYDAIHQDGAIGGVHCCANTDWGLLLATKVDILNLDAYGFIENLALYPVELREFLDKGGSICWGLIPNNEQILNENAQSLSDRLRTGIRTICEKAASRGVLIKPDEFASRSLVAPACGLGSTTPEIADRVFEVLAETGSILKRG